MEYNLYFNVCGIIFLLVQLITNIFSNRLPSRTSFYFRIFTLLCIISIIANTLFIYFLFYVNITNLTVKYLLTTINLLSVNSVAASFFVFVLSIVYDQLNFKSKHWYLVYIPLATIVILILTSPFTKWVYYFDNYGLYIRAFGNHLLYAVNLFFICCTLSEIIYHRDRVKKNQQIAVISVCAIICFIMGFQASHPSILLLGFSSSIAVYVFHYFLKNPKELINFNTDTYNRTAFKEYFFFRQKHIRDEYFCLIHITNFDMLSKTYGTSDSYRALKAQIEELKDKCKIKYVFNVFHNGFLFSCKSKEEAETILKTIHKYTPKPLDDDEESLLERIHLNFATDFYLLEAGHYLYDNFPKNNYSKYSNTLIEVFKYAIQIKTGSDKFTLLNESFLDEFHIAKKRQKTIHEAIENQSFEVFFQPIYNIHTKTFSGAESLLRLKDENDRYIPPSLFIPDAEKDGSILQLGEISLRKTCEYILEAQVRDRGISKININLSMVQCMQDNIVQSLIAILEEYNIPKTMIRFEITETMMASDPERLLNVMQDLSDYGIEFALDDYGTGYSNTSALLNFPFSEIKFDKSFLNAIMMDEKNKIPLQHLMSMVKDSNMVALVEGVEDKETAEMIEQFGGDYIQGFYFSEPLPLAEFTLKLPLKDSNN